MNIPVLQYAKDFVFEIPQKDFASTKERGTIEVPYILLGDYESIDKSIIAKPSETWCQVERITADAIVLSLEENTTSEPRTATVAVTAVSAAGELVNKEITVAQAATVNILDVYVSTINLDARGEVITLPVYSNTAINVSSSASWCKVELGNEKVTISAEANLTGEARTAYVTVTTISGKG